jgi:5-hydroxyisourate hydrolase
MSLTTHVLDTVLGAGAAGMKVDVTGPNGESATVTLDEDGRASLLEELAAGTYEISFHAGAYQNAVFFGIIPVRFNVEDPAQKHHIPLILSAYGYSTYRGV